MFGLRDRDIGYGNVVAENFDKIPQRGKALFFAVMSRDCQEGIQTTVDILTHISGLDYSGCKSPIEIIMALALDIASIKMLGTLVNALYLETQVEINCGDKKYYADFCFDTDTLDIDVIKPYKLVVECDGHEFHEKTKEQVARDNERDMNLKMNGYDVIHFSGSQIFNDPLKCAFEVIRLIVKNIEVDNGDFQKCKDRILDRPESFE